MTTQEALVVSKKLVLANKYQKFYTRGLESLISRYESQIEEYKAQNGLAETKH